MNNSLAELSRADMLALDYADKLAMLDRVTSELLRVGAEYAPVAGRERELRATLEVLKQVKSALQSSLRAEGA